MRSPLQAASDSEVEEEEEEEDEKKGLCKFQPKHYIILCVGCVFGTLSLPFLIVGVWLVCGLIAGSPGDVDYKHSFRAMAPLQSLTLDQLESKMPIMIGKAPLPQQLRGVFWVGNQSKSSALCSFGGPNDDEVTEGGKSCSSGKIGSDKKYCIRVSGDRAWSLRSSLLSFVYAVNDIRYVFTFDSAEDPKYATIQNFCDFRGWLPGYDVFFFAELFDMALMESHSTFPNSQVWKRTSVLPHRSTTYELVQVMDERGERIEPAWSAFMRYQRSVAGNTFYYRSYGYPIR